MRDINSTPGRSSKKCSGRLARLFIGAWTFWGMSYRIFGTRLSGYSSLGDNFLFCSGFWQFVPGFVGTFLPDFFVF